MFDKRMLEEISSSKGYSIALLTTFNFEIAYFERTILNILNDNNIKNIELFVDASELAKAVLESESNNFNRKYIVNPINVKASFHPKVILLLGEEKAKLIVSSANIKTSGYMLNNEIYNVFIYNKDNFDNINLINDAINFFEKLNTMAYYQDIKIFKEIDNLIYRNKKSNNDSIKLIQNLDSSVLSQLSYFVKEKVLSIDIAVPYYDKELLAYKELSKIFECNDINLYLQNGLSTFPINYNNINKVVKNDNIYSYLKLKNNGKKNFYHGKVFRINTEDKSYILYGSSNCTLSALSKTYISGGNIECNILEVGMKNDFDYFFDNFDIETFEELKCNVLEYETLEKSDYNFKYGIRKNNIKLYLSYKDINESIQVKIENRILPYEYTEKELLVVISEDIADEINNIFDLIIIIGDKQEKIRCWYFDIDSVENYRSFDKLISFEDIHIDEDMEKYREHMELIVRMIALTKDEYVEQIKLQRILNNKSVFENQNVLDEDDSDFILDKDIIDVYINKSKDFTNAYLKSKLFANRFFESLRLNGKINRENINNKEVTEINTNKNSRMATTAEKRFERFIKSRIKGILKDEYVELVDYSRYKNSIGLILDIINEYKYKEHVEDMFDDEYVIKISTDLINKLLRKELTDNNEKDIETTIILSFILILQNHIINNSKENKDNKVELNNKEIIKKLNQLFNIRDNYQSLLKCALADVMKRIKIIDYNYCVNYIDSLFGYKTKTLLLDMLKSKFGNDVEINFDKDSLTIKFSTLEINKYFKLDFLLIKELKNYYDFQNLKLVGIKIVIYNLKNEYSSSLNPIKQLIYDINQRGTYTKTMIYKNGNTIVSLPEKL